MHVRYDGVNDAFRDLVGMFKSHGQYKESFKLSPSRVGNVIQMTQPTTISFMNPQQRVLFNNARDCNPFFHLYESLWMLAGRNDIESLSYYSSGYKAQVDDGNGIANGAYGHRWIHAHSGEGHNWSNDGDRLEVNQLQTIIDHLLAVPTSRRAVLQMWNVEDDLLKIGPENQSMDICCNTAAYFSLRVADELKTMPNMTGPAHWEHEPINYRLDMTVTNRSNDLIWGLLGANIVHFSFLQEYMACCLGVKVGTYHQFTNNLHVYTVRFKPDDWLRDMTYNEYIENPMPRTKLVAVKDQFDKEVVEFVQNNFKSDGYITPITNVHSWSEPFLDKVAQPMMDAFHYHKARNYSGAMRVIDDVADRDWRKVGKNWLLKRWNINREKESE